MRERDTICDTAAKWPCLLLSHLPLPLSEHLLIRAISPWPISTWFVGQVPFCPLAPHSRYRFPCTCSLAGLETLLFSLLSSLFLLSSCNCCSVQAVFLISHCVCQSSSLEIVCLPGPGEAVKSDLGAAWHGFHHCATLLLLHPHRVYLIELGVELLELVGLILWSYFYLLFAVFFSLLNHPANCQFIYQLATLLLQSLQFVSCN